MDIKSLRGIISTILIAAFIFSYGTGAILYFSKTGMWFLFSRGFIKNVHVIFTVTMGVGVLLHLYLNRKMYVSEVKALTKSWKKR